MLQWGETHCVIQLVKRMAQNQLVPWTVASWTTCASSVPLRNCLVELGSPFFPVSLVNYYFFLFFFLSTFKQIKPVGLSVYRAILYHIAKKNPHMKGDFSLAGGTASWLFHSADTSPQILIHPRCQWAMQVKVGFLCLALPSLTSHHPSWSHCGAEICSWVNSSLSGGSIPMAVVPYATWWHPSSLTCNLQDPYWCILWHLLSAPALSWWREHLSDGWISAFPLQWTPSVPVSVGLLIQALDSLLSRTRSFSTP